MENGKIEGIRTPETYEPTVTKFGVSDYVGDVTPHTKIQSERPSVHGNGWHITLVWFLVFSVNPIFSGVPRLNRNRFYAVWFIRRQFQVTAFLEGQNC